MDHGWSSPSCWRIACTCSGVAFRPAEDHRRVAAEAAEQHEDQQHDAEQRRHHLPQAPDEVGGHRVRGRERRWREVLDFAAPSLREAMTQPDYKDDVRGPSPGVEADQPALIHRRAAARRRRIGLRQPRGGRRCRIAARRRCHQGAALRLPGRRDRLRSGAGRAICIHASSPRTSSRRRTASTTWRGRRRSCPRPRSALPEVADDFRTWTVRIRPGIYFADDPAFKGRPRELIAADYVYTWKRFFDPATRSPAYAGFLEEGVHRRRRAAPAGARRRSGHSTTTARSKACARSTATPCSSGWRRRGRAFSTRSPTAASTARWRARWSSSTANASPSIRSAPGRSGSARGAAARSIVLERNPSYREVRYDAEPDRRRRRRARRCCSASRAGACR